MKRFKQQTVKSTIKKAKSNENVKEKHPLQVYCRVRPLQSEHESTCINIEPPNSLVLTVADANRAGLQTHTRFVFKHVFDELATQEHVFNETSLPLVQNLIAGKNGLVFTYGVTNSGKSFTMEGSPEHYGIMPMCLSVIFNSINNCQAPKYLFKPDRLNGFDVQSESDALLDRQRELKSSVKNPKSTKTKDPCSHIRRPITTKKLDVKEQNVYAVFLSYTEIYNNSVSDLLEDVQADDCNTIRPPQPKIIREDGSKNMYVHGVDEVEVKSPEEALEVFYRGQKRRRLAHTALNTESSRSHCVFTIRLVQAAPPDVAGACSVDDRRLLSVSQLSLVDLAGSERSSRAKTHGQRIREAGIINNSLMTLRSCFELLRENQQNGTNKLVPYRASRLTHLFKNYFEGDGDVRMIICVNPRAEDCDEITHVLKFAEMSQEVKVNRIKPVRDVAYPSTSTSTVERNPSPSEVESDVNEPVPAEQIASNINPSFLMSCRFQQAFPVLDLTNPENNGYITETLKVLLARKEKAKELHSRIKSNASAFQTSLQSVCEGNKRQAEAIKEKDRISEELLKKMNEMDSEALNLKMKCTCTQNYLRTRENELDRRLRKVTNVPDGGPSSSSAAGISEPLPATGAQYQTPSKYTTGNALDLATYSASRSARGRQNTAGTNPRAHRRSRSAEPPNVPSDTVFQPVTKKSSKDVNKSSKSNSSR